jgi:chemotaxis protein MotB
MNPVQSEHPSSSPAFEPLPVKKTRTSHLSRGRKPASGDNANEIWFLTLSDLLLLLVIFFVLLFGLTWKQQSRSAAIIPPVAQPAVAKTPPPAQQPEAAHPDPLATGLPAQKKVPENLEQALSNSLGLDFEDQGITLERRGPELVLTFPERIAFDTGQAGLKPSAEPILEKVGAFILPRPEMLVEIHGHTDDRPIRTPRYPSNWELSADRATQVAKSLIQRGINPAQVSVKGFGEHHALVPNDSEINRLRNRRVEIHFNIPDNGPQT